MLAHGGLALAAAGLALVTWANAPVPLVYALVVLVGMGRAFAAPAVNTILPQLLPATVFASVNAWVASSRSWPPSSAPRPAARSSPSPAAAPRRFAVAAAAEAVFVILLLTRVPKAPASGPSAVRGGRARRPVVRVAQPGVPGGDHAGSLRGAVRRRGRPAADLRQGHPAGGASRPGLAARGPGRRRAADGARHHAASAVGAARSRPARSPWPASASPWWASACRGIVGLSLACLFITGICDNVSVVIRLTLEQMITPDALRGRVSAVKHLFVSMSNEIGAFESGATAALFGPDRSRWSAAAS